MTFSSEPRAGSPSAAASGLRRWSKLGARHHARLGRRLCFGATDWPLAQCPAVVSRTILFSVPALMTEVRNLRFSIPRYALDKEQAAPFGRSFRDELRLLQEPIDEVGSIGEVSERTSRRELVARGFSTSSLAGHCSNRHASATRW